MDVESGSGVAVATGAVGVRVAVAVGVAVPLQPPACAGVLISAPARSARMNRNEKNRVIRDLAKISSFG